ncbi:hypothetical protein [Streptomyces sp. NPDC085540]
MASISFRPGGPSPEHTTSLVGRARGFSSPLIRIGGGTRYTPVRVLA